MRAVIQRVSQASVRVNGGEPRSIGRGLVVLLGVAQGDGTEDVAWLARKIVGMRLFHDENERMNHSFTDIDGRILVVSQFTLLASTRKGNRPSFDPSAPPDQAMPLYEAFLKKLEELSGTMVEHGEFGASMQVDIRNEGPVTIVIDSKLKE